MVIFDQKSSKNTVFSDNFWSKRTIVSSLKPIKINRTPPFCLRGYGMSTTLKSDIFLTDAFGLVILDEPHNSFCTEFANI